jgi:hypothetical protein
MKVRRKPVALEAWQFDPEGNRAEAGTVVAWCGGLWTDHGCIVSTLEGPLTAFPGDWIVQGTAGEFWPVRKDIFENTYEPVEA